MSAFYQRGRGFFTPAPPPTPKGVRSIPKLNMKRTGMRESKTKQQKRPLKRQSSRK